MKKIYIYNDIERNTLYFGISSVYGEFILTTNGNPTSLNELEDANDEDCDALIEEINWIGAGKTIPYSSLHAKMLTVPLAGLHPDSVPSHPVCAA